MKRNICVVTGTRADYHLLYPLIRRILDHPCYRLLLAVTGSHLHAAYGETYKDIENDGIPIDAKIPILEGSDSESDINTSMSKAIKGFDQFLSGENIDLVVLLGDRYELLCAAIVAMNLRIPIAHISCGDITEGAIDECIRHSITKMSSIHFPTCEEYKKRVIQLGEDPIHVFNVGSLGVENIVNTEKLSKDELGSEIGFDLSGRFAVLTFHPVTLEDNMAAEEFGHVLNALGDFPTLKILFTKSNADSGGLQINSMIDDYVNNNPDRCFAVFSLGLRRYLSALSKADIVIGNSSSGILETPSFCVPTVNIGDRQRGRVQAKNIINCIPERSHITEAIRYGLSDEFKRYVKDTVSPYGDGTTSIQIMDKLEYFFENPEVFPLKKRFYNIAFDII